MSLRTMRLDNAGMASAFNLLTINFHREDFVAYFGTYPRKRAYGTAVCLSGRIGSVEPEPELHDATRAVSSAAKVVEQMFGETTQMTLTESHQQVSQSVKLQSPNKTLLVPTTVSANQCVVGSHRGDFDFMLSLQA